MKNNFFEFCSVHHFLYINCSHLCYFRQLCNKDCIWSSENEILILEVLERCLTLYIAGEIHGHIFLSSKYIDLVSIVSNVLAVSTMLWYV